MRESLVERLVRGERHALNIFGVLRRKGRLFLFQAENIITTAGDIFYAQKATGATPTNAFNVHGMCSAGPGTPAKSDTYAAYTVIAGSLKANDATYPHANNLDADNSGKGPNVVTHKVSYTRGDFNAASITHGLITIASPVSGSALLCGYAWATPFSKTSDDTLVVYVNHAFLGV